MPGVPQSFNRKMDFGALSMTHPLKRHYQYLLTICLVALAYVAAVGLGRLLALPSGLASPFWPAAGVAWALLLLKGRHYWPGIWLGALVGNWLLVDESLGFHWSSLLVATAATLQAVLITVVRQRYFAGSLLSFPSDRALWLFLLLAGPVICLTGATLGLAALYYSGAIVEGTLLGHWLNWWAGDVLGVLLVGPLLLMLLQRRDTYASASLLNDTMELAAVAHWAFDPRSGVYTFNDRFYALYGTTVEREGGYQMSANTYIKRFCHPDDRPRVMANLVAFTIADCSAEPGQFSHRILRPDGEARHMVVRRQLIRNGAGQVSAVHGANQDVTDRKVIEEALLESKQKISDFNKELEARVDQRTLELEQQQVLNRLLLENLVEAVIACDEDGDVFLCNQSAREWFNLGDDEGEVNAAKILNQLRARSDSREPPQVMLFRALDGESVKGLEARLAVAGNKVRQVIANAAPLVDGYGCRRGAVLTMHDVTEMRLSEQAMYEALAVLDAADDAAFIFDPDSLQITYANEGAVRQLGYSRQELLAMTPMDIEPEFDSLAFAKLVEPLLQNRGGSRHYSSRNRCKNGSLVPVEVHLQYVAPVGGAPNFICLERDISERHQAEQELRRTSEELRAAYQKIDDERKRLAERVEARTRELNDTNRQLREAKDEAERANRAKSTFLATMSHEIRTPMNGVVGMIDVLEQTTLNQQQRDMMQLVRVSALSLLDIINDIMDISKIEAGGVELERRLFCLVGVVEKSCLMMDNLATAKGVELTMFVDPRLPAGIVGDEVRLRQILLNLVSNAVKFSSEQEHGNVTVRARALSQTDKQLMLELRVADNGIGMDSETLAGLFVAYKQADGSTTRRFGGTGLGLAITKHLVDLMDGDITVQSAPGSGTVFTVVLPLAIDATAAEAAVEPRLSLDLTTSCLVVGGLSSMAEDLAAYLNHAGATVVRCDDLAEASAQLQRLGQGQYICVIDTEDESPLPSEVRQALRRQNGVELRFVVIGRGPRRSPRIIEADYVALDGNVLRRSVLLGAIACVSGQPGAANAASAKPAIPAVVAPGRAEALSKGSLILVAEDNEINQKVIVRQLEILGYAADIAVNGERALELWRSGNYALLLTDLHMPEMDGYQLTRVIRAEEKVGAHMPIIILTADKIQGNLDKYMALGMDDCLDKPVRLDDLQATLQKWMPAEVDECEQADTVRVEREPAALPVDIAELTLLIGDDSDDIYEFLQDFLRYGSNAVAEIELAYQRRDIDKIKGIAHKIKSSARAVGALRLAESFESIEVIANTGSAHSLAPEVAACKAEMARVATYIRAR